MEPKTPPEPAPPRTTVERRSDREMVVTRRFEAPARLVFKAWTTPELMLRWWAPRSMGVPLVACEIDLRAGGAYRFTFQPEGGAPMAFFGRYLEVVPDARLVWTNEESGEGAVTTVTFTPEGGGTLLVQHELYPSKAALDEALQGMEDWMPEQFGQLDALLASLGQGA